VGNTILGNQLFKVGGGMSITTTEASAQGGLVQKQIVKV
jgi:hypothetical protein